MPAIMKVYGNVSDARLELLQINLNFRWFTGTFSLCLNLCNFELHMVYQLKVNLATKPLSRLSDDVIWGHSLSFVHVVFVLTCK